MNIKPEPFTLTSDNMYMTGLVNEGESVKDCLSGDVTVPGIFEYEGTAYRVTKIGQDAFACYQNITGVTLPGSIQSIGTGAFRRCYALEDIPIPDGVTKIGAGAFLECYSLKEITIPDTVTSIGISAFEDCWSLENIVLPENLTSIGRSTFEGCTALREIILPEGMTYIGPRAFASCHALEKVLIPEGIRHVRDCAFLDCTALTDIALPEYANVDERAFLGCLRVEKKDWIITIANSEISDTAIMHFNGTEEEVRRALSLLAAEDRANDPEGYDYESNSLGQMDDGLRFATSVCYRDYHIDYTAVEDSRVEELSRDILDREIPSFEKRQGRDTAADVADKRFESLKDALFAEGEYAIEDFLGFKCSPDWDDGTIENAMDNAYSQMPDDVLEEFYREYHIQDKDEGIDR